jgi:hypothetical protein
VQALRATRLLAEIGDGRARFPTPESLASLAAVAPSTRQSGKMKTISFRWSADKPLRDADCDFAADSRHANPGRPPHDQARARGHRTRTPCGSWPGPGRTASGDAGRNTGPMIPRGIARSRRCSPIRRNRPRSQRPDPLRSEAGSGQRPAPGGSGPRGPAADHQAGPGHTATLVIRWGLSSRRRDGSLPGVPTAVQARRRRPRSGRRAWRVGGFLDTVARSDARRDPTTPPRPRNTSPQILRAAIPAAPSVWAAGITHGRPGQGVGRLGASGR